jgi:hypothetical protein
MTLTSFLTVLIVVGFFLYIGMKLFPMYQEYYAVRSAMKSLANEPGRGQHGPAGSRTCSSSAWTSTTRTT